MRPGPCVPLIITAVLAGASWARAQEIDSAALVTLEQAAGRIHSVRMAPASLRLTVGETGRFLLSFVDSAGREVDAKLADGRSVAPLFRVIAPGASIEAVNGRTVSLVARRAGGGPARVSVLRAPFPIGASDTPTFSEFPLAIEIADRPTAKIEITTPPRTAYAGTSQRLAAKVWKAGAAAPDFDPGIEWTTSDTVVARISADGVVRFAKAGKVTVSASNGGARVTHEIEVRSPAVARITVSASPAGPVRTGDVVRLTATVQTRSGATLRDARPNLAVSSGGRVNARANAALYDDLTFVAEQPGEYVVLAELAGVAGRLSIEVLPRDVRQRARQVSHTPLLGFGTSEIMVFEGQDGRDYAYLGTFGNGDRMYVFDVTNPASPVLTDSVLVDARVINDIRVDREKAATLAVLTREGASDRKDGIVILDVSQPAHPTVLSEFTETTAGGVHDVWIYQNRIYLTNNGTGDMHIIDITDPRRPRESGRWSIGTEDRYLHDLIFADGVGYLSYWDDGMVIVDVGGAGKGGTLDKPVFVSQYKYGPYGSTHHVYRYKQYAFISDELLGPPEQGGKENGPGGYVHVVDVSDLANPREVARYEVPEAGAHNTWAEDDKLFIAHYQGGLRVVDISGDLRGDLYQQGREIAWFHTAGAEGAARSPNQAMAWSPQPHKGNIFLSDLNSGMWVIKLDPKASLIP